MSVYVNFILFSVYLSYLFTHALLRKGYTVNSQMSILILLATVWIMVHAAKWVYSVVNGIEDQRVREGARLSTYIWAGYAIGLVFYPSPKPHALTLIPFMAILSARYLPLFWKARGYTPFSAGMSALAQISSLALTLRIGGSFSAAFVAAIVIWLALAFSAARRFGNHEDGGWGAALSLGQCLPAAWFFLNISNQSITYSPAASGIFLGVAAAIFAMAARAGWKAAWAEKPSGWILWAPAVLFGLSLLTNFNITQVMDRPLETYDADGKPIPGNCHFWGHIFPGLNPIYTLVRPFFEYSPEEGVFYSVYFPRLLFEYLDSSVGGYLLYLHLAGRVSFLLFLYVTVTSLREGLGMGKGPAYLLALAMAVTNIIPLQLYGGYDKIYALVTLERMQMLFAAFICFRWLLGLAERAAEGGRDRDAALLAAGFLTGMAHAFSIIYEITFGAPALIALLIAIFRRPFSPSVIAAVAAGGFSGALLFCVMLGIPVENYVYYYPYSVLNVGRSVISGMVFREEWVLPGYEVKLERQIFDAFTRDRFLLTLIHTGLLATAIAFFASIPFGARSSRHYPLGLYLLVTTLALYISRGQIWTERFMGPYTNIYFLNMALPLVPSLMAYILGFFTLRDAGQGEGGGSQRNVYVSLALAASCVNGAHIGWWMPGWIPAQNTRVQDVALLSRGVGEAFDHLYTHLSKPAFLGRGAPNSDFLLPYSAMRDKIFDLISLDLIPLRPPYVTANFISNRPLEMCKFCLKGPDFRDIPRFRIYGANAPLNWEPSEIKDWTVFMRQAENLRVIYFKGAAEGASTVTANLPADGRHVVADLRHWTRDGMLVRSTTRLLSMPAAHTERAKPALAGEKDDLAPSLAGETGFVAAGPELKIQWAGITPDRYEISVSGWLDQYRDAASYFAFTTEGTSAQLTGLPADCRYVYIHLEAYNKGAWHKNSYLIYSAPAEYQENPAVCPAGWDSGGKDAGRDRPAWKK